MNQTEIVNEAVRILAALDREDGSAVPLETLSQSRERRHVWPLVQRLAAAGIVSLREDQTVSLIRPLAELTALEVLQAVWSQPRPNTTFKVLYAAHKNQAASTALESVLWTETAERTEEERN